jgi:hypothetical protein
VMAVAAWARMLQMEVCSKRVRCNAAIYVSGTVCCWEWMLVNWILILCNQFGYLVCCGSIHIVVLLSQKLKNPMQLHAYSYS